MASSTYRTRALAIALTQVGTKEHPAGSNRGPRVDQYERVTGAIGEPWCASFVQWCFKQAGCPQPLMNRTAYVPFIVDYARQHGWIVEKPCPGDLVCYDWPGESPGVADHVGIYRRSLGGTRFEAVEGNTATGNDSNGGEVMIRVRDTSLVQAFVRVPGGKPPAKLGPLARLRARHGYWSWLAWYLGEGAWKKYGPKDPNARPSVTPRVHTSWWKALRLFLAARR